MEIAFLRAMFDDLRYGLRLLIKNPGFGSLAILTLALGLGANIAVFSVVNAMLLRPLPAIADPANLASIYRVQKTDVFDNLSFPDYLDIRDRNRSFSGLAAHTPIAFAFSYGTAERVRGDMVTGNYFEVLGVKPAAGRLLTTSDDNFAAVLSYGLWQRKFGGNTSIAGTRIVLNGYPFTVIGVAAANFRGTEVDNQTDVWVPIATVPRVYTRLSPGILRDRAAGWVWIFGRLKPRIRSEQAQAELQAIAAQLAQAYPVTNEGRSVNLAGNFGMYPDDRAEISGLLALLSGSVAVLLLIACANVAGLFMVRASRRSREIAVRLAVGAGRGRLIRQLITEGLLLSAIAAVVGLLLSQWATAAAVAFSQSTSRLHRVDLSVDSRVIAFTLAICAVAGFLFALAPALQSAKLDLAGALKNGSSGGGRQRTRMRAALVAGQVALSFILLSASGMMLRGLYRIVSANPGFETRSVAMTSIDLNTLPNHRELGLSIEQQILEAVAQVPGVVSATLAATVPPEDFSGREPIFYPGQEPPPELLHGRSWAYGLWVDVNNVGPKYFQTLGIPLVEGRDFTARDRAGSPGVVIVSQKLARRLWPNQSAVGQRIAWPEWNGPKRPPFEVVGVAADAKYRSLIGDPPLLMYVPALWNYRGRTYVVFRTAANPAGMIADVERAIRQVNKDVPVFGSQTMTQHAAESLWQQRMAATWIGAFSLMALALAAVGLYVVIAQSVAQRTRELGIRVALGAAPGGISRLVIRKGMTLAVLGMVIGIPAALALDGVMGSLLPGLNGKDPATLASIAILLAAVMLGACWIPARRAARVDPIVALRCE